MLIITKTHSLLRKISKCSPSGLQKPLDLAASYLRASLTLIDKSGSILGRGKSTGCRLQSKIRHLIPIVRNNETRAWLVIGKRKLSLHERSLLEMLACIFSIYLH